MRFQLQRWLPWTAVLAVCAAAIFFAAPAQPADEPIEDPASLDGVSPEATPTADPATLPTLAPASLDGVQPGRSTRQQVREKWGDPKKVVRIAGGARETYGVEKLGSVRVTIADDVVHSLSVHVEHPMALAVIARRLAIDDVEPVNVYDDRGDLLGAAYPERGMLLGYVPRTQPSRVFQVMIEPLDAQPFLARAEARLSTRYADCLADLEQALELAPDSAEAYRLVAEVALRSGDLDTALASAQRAIELDPDALAHRLIVARVLAVSGDYPQAIARVRDLLDEPHLPDVVAARAWCLWGDFLARSARHDYAEAIKHHQRAIALAAPLVDHERCAVRREAKEVLLDAHLAVAYDIGWGRWQQKATIAAKWIERATSFADDLMDHERLGPEVHVRVYTQALAALAGIAEPPDAGKWIRGIRQVGMRMYDEAVDGTYRAHLAWQLAQALSHAVEIETARHRPSEALALGNSALTLFEESEGLAGKLPTYHYQRGQLCYRLGIVHAIEGSDHAQALVWFDKAAPLLEKPVPAAAIDPASQGETFVSMAVSYWERNNRREALRLTSQGLKLMEQAVGEGSLDAQALAVPYGNLASMHEALGDHEAAQKYSELAARHENDATTK